MRQKILTAGERKAIEDYLKDRKGSGMIHTLRYRAKKFLPRLKEEMALLEAVLSK